MPNFHHNASNDERISLTSSDSADDANLQVITSLPLDLLSQLSGSFIIDEFQPQASVTPSFEAFGFEDDNNFHQVNNNNNASQVLTTNENMNASGKNKRKKSSKGRTKKYVCSKTGYIVELSGSELARAIEKKEVMTYHQWYMRKDVDMATGKATKLTGEALEAAKAAGTVASYQYWIKNRLVDATTGKKTELTGAALEVAKTSGTVVPYSYWHERSLVDIATGKATELTGTALETAKAAGTIVTYTIWRNNRLVDSETGKNTKLTGAALEAAKTAGTVTPYHYWINNLLVDHLTGQATKLTGEALVSAKKAGTVVTHACWRNNRLVDKTTGKLTDLTGEALEAAKKAGTVMTTIHWYTSQLVDRITGKATNLTGDALETAKLEGTVVKRGYWFDQRKKNKSNNLNQDEFSFSTDFNENLPADLVDSLINDFDMLNDDELEKIAPTSNKRRVKKPKISQEEAIQQAIECVPNPNEFQDPRQSIFFIPSHSGAQLKSLPLNLRTEMGISKIRKSNNGFKVNFNLTVYTSWYNKHAQMKSIDPISETYLDNNYETPITIPEQEIVDSPRFYNNHSLPLLFSRNDQSILEPLSEMNEPDLNLFQLNA